MTERAGELPVDAYIGIGANLGDAHSALVAALAALSGLPESELVRRSSIYRSAPIDSGGPDYLNAVAHVRTRLSPRSLLKALQDIELAHGRERPYRNAPRTLDLDVLLYGKEILGEPELTVPHPRAHERAFVLAPLAELEPGLEIPGHGSVTQCLARTATQRIDKLP